MKKLIKADLVLHHHVMKQIQHWPQQSDMDGVCGGCAMKLNYIAISCSIPLLYRSKNANMQCNYVKELSF